MTSTIKAAEMTDSINQPVRNCAGWALRRNKKDAEGQVIEDGTDQTEGNHKISNKTDVPAPWFFHQFLIHPIGGNGQLREIGQQIGQQDLFGQQGQKGQKEGGPGHAEHVAEIGAGGHKDILQGIGKGGPAFS